MKKLTTSGFICLEDNFKFVYKIAKIEYEEWEDGNFNYIFRPYYNVINILPDSLFQGIPGLDLSLKRTVYERKNIVPTFISERTPSENREDLWELLEECNMQSLNRLEWLIRTDKRYSGDRFFVIPILGNETLKHKTKSMYDLVKRSDCINKKLLEIICFGDYLYTEDFTIDDISRPYYYNLLMPMYIHDYERKKVLKNKGIEKAKERNIYKGREKIKIDPLFLSKVLNDYLKGKISQNKASSMLKISRSTFYRRLKDAKQKNS